MGVGPRHHWNVRRMATAVALLILFVGAAASVPETAGAASGGASPFEKLDLEPAPCSPSSKTSILPVPPSQVTAVESAVESVVGEHMTSLGQCAHGLLYLALTPGSEALARRVRARFGPAVQIVVGFTVWNGSPGRSPRCLSVPSDAKPPKGFTATLELDAKTVTSGANFNGHIELRNPGTTAVEVDTSGPLTVELVRPGTRDVVATYSGAIAGVGGGDLLAPGHTDTVRVVGGTARCDGGLGSAAPPGRYEAVALLSVPGSAGTGPAGDAITTFVPVQIVRAR